MDGAGGGCPGCEGRAVVDACRRRGGRLLEVRVRERKMAGAGRERGLMARRVERISIGLAFIMLPEM